MEMKTTKGMTLVELMIAVAIVSLIMAGFSMLFMKTWRTNSYVLESGQATMEASHALDIIAKDLRRARQGDNSAYPIKVGNSFDLTIYSDVDGDGATEQVHYFLDDEQNLKRGISEPTGASHTYPASDDSVQTIARYIVNSKTDPDPLFFYYDKSYPGNAVPLATPILVTDARLIRIHLWVNIKPIIAPENVNLESFVELRNLNENLY